MALHCRDGRRHGVTTVKVFVSLVRNQAGPDSDLDLLIGAVRQLRLLRVSK